MRIEDGWPVIAQLNWYESTVQVRVHGYCYILVRVWYESTVQVRVHGYCYILVLVGYVEYCTSTSTWVLLHTRTSITRKIDVARIYTYYLHTTVPIYRY